MTEWADFLSQYTMKTAELIIVGDINIHLDDATHHHTTDMMQTLHSYGLKQYIHEATHYCGHTLDVLIHRDCSTLLSAIDVKDIGLCDNKGNLVNGHYAITCTLHHHAAEIKSKSVSYLQLKSINTARFKQDIQESAILLPSLSKIFEYVLLEQLTNYFVEYNLLSPHQYGFRAKHSTELAALNIQGVPKKKKDIINIHIKSEGIIIFSQKFC